MANFSYWIGVDSREPDALAVTEYSARAHASCPVNIHHIEHQDLRNRQWFNRPWRIAEDGGFWDERDGRPFSVAFSHSRFLAGLLAKEAGYTGWALFSDCDFMWLGDLHNILNYVDESKTVMVVPHNFQPEAKVKMDGQPQSRYHRKLWSALMLWNLSSSKLPTIEMVNQAEGRYLHGFGWLKNSDIGFLPEAFHWIPNYSPTTEAAIQSEQANKVSPIEAVHFTFGPPVSGMVNREPTPFDEIWKGYLIDATRNRF